MSTESKAEDTTEPSTPAAEAPPQPWSMPEWMEPYRHLIGNTGGNTIEDLIQDLDTNERLFKTNIVRYLLAVSVKSQVHLLAGLRKAGALV